MSNQIYNSFVAVGTFPNFDRDCFPTYDQMINIGTDVMDEGHISYCIDKKTHYVYCSIGSSATPLTGANRWTPLSVAESGKGIDELAKKVVFIIDEEANLKQETLAENLGLGRIVFAKDTDKLYYNTYGKGQRSEYQVDTTGWFRELLKKDDYDNAIISLGSQIEDKVSINELNIILGSIDLQLAGKVSTEKFDETIISLGSQIKDKVSTEKFDETIISLGSQIKDKVSTEKFDETIISLGSQIEDKVSTEVFNTTIEDLNNKIENVDHNEDLLNDLSARITTNSEAIGAVQENLNKFKIDADNTYAKQSEYVSTTEFQKQLASPLNRIAKLEDTLNEESGLVADVKNVQTILGDEESGLVADVKNAQTILGDEESGLVADVKNVQTILGDEESGLIADVKNVQDTYSNVYNPIFKQEQDGEHWVGSNNYGELSGKTKTEINNKYSYDQVLDNILFNKVNPKITYPSVNMDLKRDPETDSAHWFLQNNIQWYDEKNRIILVKAYSVTPNSEDFKAINIKDGEILYDAAPANILKSNKYTDGLRLSSDDAPSTIGLCKIYKDGEWINYDANFGLPDAENFTEGEYRYHIAAFFKQGDKVLNNYNQQCEDPWFEETAVESEDYITIIASKPTLYNTKDGFIENPLVLWGDEISDYIELAPSCQLDQSFKTPRKLKSLGIWNDIAGDYAVVPMVYQKDEKGNATTNLVPSYFEEIVDEDGYYTYIYNSKENGHRGAIKIKVTF